jgi:hypothetical protein
VCACVFVWEEWVDCDVGICSLCVCYSTTRNNFSHTDTHTNPPPPPPPPPHTHTHGHAQRHKQLGAGREENTDPGQETQKVRSCSHGDITLPPCLLHFAFYLLLFSFYLSSFASCLSYICYLLICALNPFYLYVCVQFVIECPK